MASRHVATDFPKQIKECRKKIQDSFKRSREALKVREYILLSGIDEIEEECNSKIEQMNKLVEVMSLCADTLTDNKLKDTHDEVISSINRKLLELTANEDTSIEFEWDNRFETCIEQLGSIKLNNQTTQFKFHRGQKYTSTICTPTRGLKNLGNTCFMNCILQCLSHTLPLKDFFVSDEYEEHLKTKGDLSYAFKCAMYELWIHSSTIDPYAPEDLKRRMGIVAPRFSGYNQQDAHEFMRFLLNELHEEINKADVKDPLSPRDNETLQEAYERYLTWENSIISELFSGMLRSVVSCSVCRHRSIVYLPFMDLALPIPESKKYQSISHDTPTQPAVKLDACMKVFTREETLDEEERPYCNKCENITKSTKQLSIAKLPKFLVIQLKRFSGYSVRSKLSTHVEFEERWKICDNSGKTHTYSLYGIACHSGGIYGGHYTAYCKYNKQWRCFNDRHTEARNWDRVKCQEAYILFFEKN